MRILNWVQNKISGRNEKKRSNKGSSSDSARYNAVPDDRKEEFSDWPHCLLAIGTFGNNELREDSQRHTFPESSHSSSDLPDFTQEEVSKLQKELTKLLALKLKSSAHGLETGVGEIYNLPLDKFLNCPSSLEIDRKTSQQFCEDLENGDDGDLSPDTKIILNRAKDVLADSRKKIRQKSLSFLPKKMFLCRSGFAPAPSLRYPLPESRMEKLVKAILYRKIYPQRSAPAGKKYLEKKSVDKTDKEGKAQGKTDDGCKWVKTDSEYIVLEI